MTARIGGPAPDPAAVKALLAIAAMHYLYRKVEIALNIVCVAEHIAPGDRTVLEMKVVLLSELHDHAAVITACQALERTVRDVPAEIVMCRRVAQRALSRRA